MMKMTNSSVDARMDAIRTALLSQATDDFYGLWEAVPAARSIIDGSDADLREITATVLRDLWEKGSIVFVWGDPHPQPDQPLAAADVIRVLSEAAEGDDERPYAGRTVWFTTELGSV